MRFTLPLVALSLAALFTSTSAHAADCRTSLGLRQPTQTLAPQRGRYANAIATAGSGTPTVRSKFVTG